ncbi:hypothetical protein DKG75_01675 [Zavarzinia compransoris]|uniref:Uncharacterized protein n=2 Tax=Zavarzinia compransoris TaxID=1264899 RepID=A0A317EAI2_9PROT|nr:hypothetical protein DKG75_01675 [Zavarzinia compransoris]
MVCSAADAAIQIRAFIMAQGGADAAVVDDRQLPDLALAEGLVAFRVPAVPEAGIGGGQGRRDEIIALGKSLPRTPKVATPPPAAPNAVRPIGMVEAASVPVDLDDRFVLVLERVPDYLPVALRREFLALFTPEIIAITAGILAVWALSHLVGVGFLVDGALVLAAFAMVGMAFVDVVERLMKAIRLTVNAKKPADLLTASQLLADLVAEFGVEVFSALVTRGLAKKKVGRKAASEGGPPPPRPRMEPAPARPSEPPKAPPPSAVRRKSLDYIPTSKIKIEAEEGRVVTILGSYTRDMKYIIKELGLSKTNGIVENPKGFNVLNVNDEKYIWKDDFDGEGFWEEVNEKFILDAIARGDKIVLATPPRPENLYKDAMVPLYGKQYVDPHMELTGFGKEYFLLQKHGYRYDPRTSTMVPGAKK